MRQTVIQCDHCHDKTDASSLRASDMRVVRIAIDIGDFNDKGKCFDGDLCEDCRRELAEQIQTFMAGPRAKTERT